MTITFAAPSNLWLLIALPIVWLATWWARSTFDRRQRFLQTLARSLLLALIVGALAQPVASVPRSRSAVVYLVDVSHSIASGALAAAADRMDALTRAIAPDRSSIMVFGADTEVVADTNAVRRLASAQARTDSARAAATDLQDALLAARAELRPGEAPRIVLFSDGRETRGDVHVAALQLAADGIPVFAEPLGVKNLGDAWVDAIHVPEDWPAGAAVTIVVDVWSQRAAGEATVVVRDGDASIGAVKTTIADGLTPIDISVTLQFAGAHALSATLEADGDPLAANNRLAREVVVQPRTRVLYIDGTPDRGVFLRRALEQAGLSVTARQPAALPTRPSDFSAWDAVIVSDVERANLSDESMRALGTFVERDGGGLFLAGGDSIFGDGGAKPTGYHGTEIERLLPVTIEREDRPDVALVMVLDKSTSMTGAAIELCKAAAQAAVDALDDRQIVGVLTFNDRLDWTVRPTTLGPNREVIRQAIAAIQPSGDTLIFPALEQAYLALRDVQSNAKHVILLSDGRSYPDDYQGLVAKMVAAKMTVSSIALGREADAQMLGRIARWGKGRAYAVVNPKGVTQIFVKEARSAMPAFDDGQPIVPIVKARSVLASVDLSGMPPLRGRTAMVLKDSATAILTTPTGDPMLAWWPVGRGRTAAFASDVKDRWAREWVNWQGYGPVFATLVRAIARHPVPPMTLDLARIDGSAGWSTFRIGVEARDAEGDYRELINPLVRILRNGARAAALTAHQVAPGRYEATVTADADDALAIEVTGPEGPSVATRLVVPDSDAEYRFRPPDEALLKGVAVATGGVFAPHMEELRTGRGPGQAERRALWPVLVVLASLLWPVDILLRRIRLFDVVAQPA